MTDLADKKDAGQLKPVCVKELLSRYPAVERLLGLRKDPEAFAKWLETGER